MGTMGIPSTEARNQIKSILVSQVRPADYFPMPFLFTVERPGHSHPALVLKNLHLEWEAWCEQTDPALWDILTGLTLGAPAHDVTLTRELQTLADSLPGEGSSRILETLVSKIIRDILAPDHPQVSPQLFVELLRLLLKSTPEFVIVTDPLLQIVGGVHPALKRGVRTLACAVLIAHFEVETLFIHIAGHSGFSEMGRQVLFQSLSAFQKIYRKILELQKEIGNKDHISQHWFGVDFDTLKKRGEFRENFSSLVQQFIERLQSRDQAGALSLGRFLVLRYNNEDILRLIHQRIRSGELEGNGSVFPFVFRQIYRLMQEFRRMYISREVEAALFEFLSDHQAQSLESLQMITIGRVPVQVILQGWPSEHRPPGTFPLNPELSRRLVAYNLSALYDLYPLPPHSQEIVLILSHLAEDLELVKDELVTFIAYLERVMVFLQQLEELNIRVLESPGYGLILNPFQMNSLSLIQEGAYFGSTGFWPRSRVPPCLIRCINPHAIPNCLGVLDRHIFSRVSPLTGAFRGTPFDLDSTNRYDWDEEPETCQIRPGFFLVHIPQPLLTQWEKSQALQKEALREKIGKKDWDLSRAVF